MKTIKPLDYSEFEVDRERFDYEWASHKVCGNSKYFERQFQIVSHRFVIKDKETYAFLHNAKCNFESILKLPFPEITIGLSRESASCAMGVEYCNFPAVILTEDERYLLALGMSYIYKSGQDSYSRAMISARFPRYEEEPPKLSDALLNYVGNFLSLISSVHVDYSPPTLTRQERRRRERKGIEDNNTYISIDPTLRAYLQEDKSNQGVGISPIGHWVRGHWRLLLSEFYTIKRGKLTWVRPHVSGSIEDLVNKPYLVKTNGGVCGEASSHD